MESSLAEATALSQKSEREYITLRDSIKGLVESFKNRCGKATGGDAKTGGPDEEGYRGDNGKIPGAVGGG